MTSPWKMASASERDGLKALADAADQGERFGQAEQDSEKDSERSDNKSCRNRRCKHMSDKLVHCSFCTDTKE
jgi:hypothetical protein